MYMICYQKRLVYIEDAALTERADQIIRGSHKAATEGLVNI
jgi:hypothetical protein